MKFVDITQISEETVTVVARFSGQVVRIGSEYFQSSFPEEKMECFGSGMLSLSTGDWDQLSISKIPEFFCGNTLGTQSTTGISVFSKIRNQLFPIVENEAPNQTFADPEAASWGDNEYVIVASASNGSTSTTEIALHVESHAMWISAGPGYSEFLRLYYNVDMKLETGRASKKSYRFAGATYPSVYADKSREKAGTVSATLWYDDEENSTPEKVEEISFLDGPFLLRHWKFGCIYADIGSIQQSETVNSCNELSFSYSAVRHARN